METRSAKLGTRNARRPAGSALIVVLWVVGLLSMMITSLVFDAHIEARITSYTRKRVKAEALARSGIDVAELLMVKSAGLKGKREPSKDDEDADKWWYDGALRLGQGLPLEDRPYPLGAGTIRVSLVPEPARRNVNLLKEDDWERIFEVAGLPEEMWAPLVDSFYDWIDTDGVPRKDGAETEDYYATLEKPYQAKNGPLDTVGELLLIRGFARPIVYGGVLKPANEKAEPLVLSGIEDLLTTYGDGKVNVNAASPRVLMTLPGVDEVAAGAIIEEREGRLRKEGGKENTSYQSVADLFQRVPGLDPALQQYITTDSAIYRVTSVGDVGGVTREIWCIAQFNGRNLQILRWREDN